MLALESENRVFEDRKPQKPRKRKRPATSAQRNAWQENLPPAGPRSRLPWWCYSREEREFAKTLRLEHRADGDNRLRKEFPKLKPNKRPNWQGLTMSERWRDKCKGGNVPAALKWQEWQEFRQCVPLANRDFSEGRTIDDALQSAIAEGLLPDTATEDDFLNAYAGESAPDWLAMARELMQQNGGQVPSVREDADLLRVELAQTTTESPSELGCMTCEQAEGQFDTVIAPPSWLEDTLAEIAVSDNDHDILDNPFCDNNGDWQVIKLNLCRECWIELHLKLADFYFSIGDNGNGECNSNHPG